MLKTRSKTPRKTRKLWSRIGKPQRTKKQERNISAQTQPAHEAPHESLYFNHSSPVAPRNREEAMGRALLLITHKREALRDRAYEIRLSPNVLVARVQKVEAERNRLEKQGDALAAVGLYGEWTPEQEICALEAVVEHYPQGAKVAGAARLFNRFGNTLTFHVPSANPKKRGVPYLTTFNGATKTTHCNCPAKSECWHEAAVRYVAELYAGLHSPCEKPALITPENLTASAFDAVEALDSCQNTSKSAPGNTPHSVTNPHAARLNALLDNLEEWALQGAHQCYETRRDITRGVDEARRLAGAT